MQHDPKICIWCSQSCLSMPISFTRMCCSFLKLKGLLIYGHLNVCAITLLGCACNLWTHGFALYFCNNCVLNLFYIEFAFKLKMILCQCLGIVALIGLLLADLSFNCVFLSHFELDLWVGVLHYISWLLWHIDCVVLTLLRLVRRWSSNIKLRIALSIQHDVIATESNQTCKIRCSSFQLHLKCIGKTSLFLFMC